MPKMMKICISISIVLGIVLLASPDTVCADAGTDVLLKLLVKKGMITQREADEVEAEISQVTEYVPARAEMDEHAKKASWAEKIKLKGDMKYRNEIRNLEGQGWFYRQLVMPRVGVVAEVADTFTAGVGVAAGTNGDGTGRTTWQTLEGEFGTFDINLDYAYVQWKPVKEIKMAGGKFSNPLYRRADLLWDTDLRFEGAAANVKYPLEGLGIDVPMDLYVNNGFFIIDYLGGATTRAAKNPYLIVSQVGIGSSYEELFDWKAFAGYLDFINIQNSKAAGLAPGTRSGIPNSEGDYAHDFNVMELSGEVTFHFLEDGTAGPFDKPLTFIGDFVWNSTGGTAGLDGYDKACGWLAGVELGKTPKALGEWMIHYNFRRLDRNAFPDEFPDLLMFSGRTNGFGHKVWTKIGLAKNWWLYFRYCGFRDKSIVFQGDAEKWGQIFQADVHMKF